MNDEWQEVARFEVSEFVNRNEFRYFDSKDIKFSSERIGNIDFIDNIYHIYPQICPFHQLILML